MGLVISCFLIIIVIYALPSHYYIIEFLPLASYTSGSFSLGLKNNSCTGEFTGESTGESGPGSAVPPKQRQRRLHTPFPTNTHVPEHQPIARYSFGRERQVVPSLQKVTSAPPGSK